MRRIVIPVDNSADARRAVGSPLIDAPAEVMETAQLLVSELATNALVPGSGCAALAAELRAQCLHVEVLDSGPTVDLVSLEVEASRSHGRGLAIVDALASSWGVEPRFVGVSIQVFTPAPAALRRAVGPRR
jgi:anti-sigma regulatory factor (Ser/Thr protein kinase)